MLKVLINVYKLSFKIVHNHQKFTNFIQKFSYCVIDLNDISNSIKISSEEKKIIKDIVNRLVNNLHFMLGKFTSINQSSQPTQNDVNSN